MVRTSRLLMSLADRASGLKKLAWRLLAKVDTSLSRWSKEKFKSPCNFEESPYKNVCRRPRIFSTCHLWKCRYRARVYWNISYPLLIILKVIFLESNPGALRFIETLISFIRGFVYCFWREKETQGQHFR